ncbi:APC family permease [Salinisphaera sp. USBA-960]|uniref:APC family permease n=1 Tax=Salinisphaera orenii TaxID=856731 RepID=UPI000DBE0DA6|nr:APC family permease [Salifodinibacter halophilus]NNC25618.1 APC family permease [Salifodinibacter halophilus]
MSTSETSTGLRRDIGSIGLLFVSVGAVVGSGWLLSALPAARMAGPASILAWVIGAAMIALIGLVNAELGTMFPISGAVVRFPHFTHGSLTSVGIGWLSWLVAVSLGPVEVEAVLQYATNYLPFLTRVVDHVPVLTTAGYGVAAALLFVFCFINIFGIRYFARLNAVLVVWKLGVIALLVAVFMWTAFDPGHFSAHGGFAPFGAHGVFAAITSAGIAYSYFGFRQGVELAGECRNPQRAVPLSILGTLGITVILYALVQAAFIGALPDVALTDGWAKLDFANAFGPLAGVAQILGLFWLTAILYADAIVSPADTGLIYATTTARIAYAMGRSGNAPPALGNVSRRGVPWISVIVTYVVGLLIFLPFPGWQKLAAFLVAAYIVAFGSGPVAVLALRRALPDQHRPFRLPAAPLLAYLAFYATSLLLYWVGWTTLWKMLTALIIGYVLYAIYRCLPGSPRPSMHILAGSWLPAWLLGMFAIATIGNYGGAGWLTPATSFPLIAVFSAIVLWWGVINALPADGIRDQLDTTVATEEAAPSAAT